MSGLSASEQLLPLFGADPTKTQQLDFGNGWDCKSVLRHDGTKPPVQVILVSSGPKNIAEVRKMIKADKCIVLLTSGRTVLMLRALGTSCTVAIEGDGELGRVLGVLRKCGLSGKEHGMAFNRGMLKSIKALPMAAEDFDNRGVFSTHYLKSRIWDDLQRDIRPEVKAASTALGGGAAHVLGALGWDVSNKTRDGICRAPNVSIVLTEQRDLGLRTDASVAPSYRAVSELRRSPWVILTNGTLWRLYTRRVSASTTNYFEIDTSQKSDIVTRYLVALFGATSYEGDQPAIDAFFDQSKEKSRALEDDLRAKILRSDGLFLDIVKGLLDHDGKKAFDRYDLDSAKERALAVMYRIWFILYAESRNLLPTTHKKYAEISLRSLRGGGEES